VVEVVADAVVAVVVAVEFAVASLHVGVHPVDVDDDVNVMGHLTPVLVDYENFPFVVGEFPGNFQAA
jgi:hypothetical protein